MFSSLLIKNLNSKCFNSCRQKKSVAVVACLFFGQNSHMSLPAARDFWAGGSAGSAKP